MRKLKDEPCSECNKKGAYCKGMCQACYSKHRRNTETGKKGMQKYNATKGKEATKRYRDKLNANKPTKPIKKDCECGKKSIAKGLCRNCYQNQYGKSKRAENYQPRKTKTNNFPEYYKLIIKEIEKGNGIRQSCENVGVSSSYLYMYANDIQKQELRRYKAIYGRL